jgi:hypothetical protein
MRYVSLAAANGTNGFYAVADLVGGVITTSAGIGAGTVNATSIQQYNNGWYRAYVNRDVTETDLINRNISIFTFRRHT